MIFRVAGAERDHLIRFPLKPVGLCGLKLSPQPLRGFKPLCRTCLRAAAARPELLSENPGERQPTLVGLGL